VSAASPWLKMFCLLEKVSAFLPSPIVARNFLGSKPYCFVVWHFLCHQLVLPALSYTLPHPKHGVASEMFTFCSQLERTGRPLRKRLAQCFFARTPIFKFAGIGRLPSGVLDADMCPIHGKSADRMRQTCPNCKRSKILKLVKPAEEQPRKNYCIECGHEWWEFDKKPVASADPRGM
jgi:hypothetical protein